MRIFLLLSFLLVDAGFASSQVVVVSGEASSVAPGAYALPFEPRLTTPEQQFPTPQLQVGASNATGGLVAGASNSTLDTAVSDQRVAPGGFYVAPTETTTMSSAAGSQPTLDLGAAISQESIGVAQLAAGVHDYQRASRIFTNADLDRLKK